MGKLIVLIIIEFIAISPLIFGNFDRSGDKWKNLLLFASYYCLYLFLLSAPTLFPELQFVESNLWNWSGKTYAITGSLLFYSLFRKSFANHNFISFKQNNNSLRPKFFIVLIIFILTIGLSFLIKYSDENISQLKFQFTMPGIDEELAFRGIMLGILSNTLRSKIHIGSINLGNPSLIITSILFGLGHSLKIDDIYNFHQNWFEFVNMFAIGLLLGWMTIKSGSIIMAILSHNLINTLPKIILWIL